jgi:hypothetical protein
MAAYARRIPKMKAIFADYARRGGMDYESLTYTVDKGMPVFHAMTNWGNGIEGLERQVRDTVGDRRPAFGNVFICNWFFSMEALAELPGRLGDEFVWVTPSQLADLYRQAGGR